MRSLAIILDTMAHTGDIHTPQQDIFEDIIQKYSTYGDESEIKKIYAAYEHAKDAHKGVLRKSGDDYIIHPISAAKELMVLQPDSTTIIATLLHDVVSHGASSYEEIEKIF